MCFQRQQAGGARLCVSGTPAAAAQQQRIACLWQAAVLHVWERQQRRLHGRVLQLALS
jgi:hypothetical protein